MIGLDTNVLARYYIDDKTDAEAQHQRAYFSPSWTAFQADRGRDFRVMVDGVSV